MASIPARLPATPDHASTRQGIAGPLVALAFLAGATAALLIGEALWVNTDTPDSVISLLWLTSWVLLAWGLIVALAFVVATVRRAFTRRRVSAWAVAILIACVPLAAFALSTLLPGAGSGTAG